MTSKKIVYTCPIVVLIVLWLSEYLLHSSTLKVKSEWDKQASSLQKKFLEHGIELNLASHQELYIPQLIKHTTNQPPQNAQPNRSQTVLPEPVTSGIPLPEGCVTNVNQLCLLDSSRKPVPCQFTVLSHWPAREGTAKNSTNRWIKWVLLDFLTDPANTSCYSVVVYEGRKPPVPNPVSVLPIQNGYAIKTGKNIIGIATNVPGIIHAVVVNGKHIIGKDNPVQVSLVNEDGKIYKCSAPSAVEIESAGPVRATVLVKGNFVSEDGSRLMDGNVKYGVRITVYAGCEDIRVAFTLKNHGPYYGKKRQWLYFKSLTLDVPVTWEEEKSETSTEYSRAVLCGHEFELPHGESCSLVQWYKHPYQDRMNYMECSFEDEDAIADKCGMENLYEGFYWRGTGIWVEEKNQKPEVQTIGRPGRLSGWAELRGKDKEVIVGMAVRRFYQNFPCGFSAKERKLSYLILPEGGFWPRNKKAHDSRTYQFEGGRHKTWEFCVWFVPHISNQTGSWKDGDVTSKNSNLSIISPVEMERRLNEPAFMRAGIEWYKDTGAIWPLAGEVGRERCILEPDPIQEKYYSRPRLPAMPLPPDGTPGIWAKREHIGEGNENIQKLWNKGGKYQDLVEAMERYDRLQRAKVRLECGDSAGLIRPEEFDQWRRVSIPELRERCPDLFCGWMNYGDLLWSFGYCSLYYDFPYGMLIQYLRLGDRALLDVAEDMIRHRYDIDQWHTGEGKSGWQRYEKSWHGHKERVGAGTERWDDSGQPSHTWNRGLLLYWALRGDKNALESAIANGQAYYEFWYGGRKLAQTNKVFYSEFRVPGWTIENWLALYEYTGEKKYLDWSNELFDKTLLAMEKANGSKGHILKDGHQGAQFMAYIIEPVCRLHYITGRRDILLFLKRVLDWQRKELTVGGVTENGTYYPIMWITGLGNSFNEKPKKLNEIKLEACHLYSIMFCDGYMYLGAMLNNEEDIEFGRRLFTEVMCYYPVPPGCNSKTRMPLGYHSSGTPFGFTPKAHAFTGRYGQLFLRIEGI